MWWLQSKMEFHEIVFIQNGVFRTLNNPTDVIVNLQAGHGGINTNITPYGATRNIPKGEALATYGPHNSWKHKNQWRVDNYYRQDRFYVSGNSGSFVSFGSYATCAGGFGSPPNLERYRTWNYQEHWGWDGWWSWGDRKRKTWESGRTEKKMNSQPSAGDGEFKTFVGTLPPNTDIPITVSGGGKITIYYKES